jgi:hypothetical protein
MYREDLDGLDLRQGRETNAYRILVGNPAGLFHLEDRKG